MTAFAWDVEADTVKQLLAADEHRDEYVLQLHTQAEAGADSVFLAFGEDSVTETGIMLPSVGSTVRVLGPKARLAVSALSAAVSSGGGETYTSIEYRHTLNYPIWQKQPGQGIPPVAIHYCPFPDTTVTETFDPFIIMFDMNVITGAPGTEITLWEFVIAGPDILRSTIDVANITADGGVATFSLIAFAMSPMKTYYFKADEGVLISADDGSPWSGIDDGVAWTFNTT